MNRESRRTGLSCLGLTLVASGVLSAQQFMTGQAARAVIGQPNFTSQDPTVSQFTVGHAGGIAYVNDTLFIVDGARVMTSDQQNHRVLMYRNISSMFPQPKDSFPWDGAERCPLCAGSADIVLGQPDFSSKDWGPGRDKMRNPTAVATDGRRLAIADTDNNRVLVWNSIPTTMNQPADVVVGQSDFNAVALNFGRGRQVNERGLSGPQGVWIDLEGALWVADTVNNRVVKWNNVPTQNGAPADLVLGAPNLTTPVEIDIARGEPDATASNMLNPASVTVDPTGRVLVSDLGYNRVLVWNQIPRRNAEPADFALGQIDVATTTERNAQRANNSLFLCRPTGIDSDGTITFPTLCEATLNFPRYALSDGRRVFIADAGNDRILVYNSMPTNSGERADIVLGQVEPTAIADGDALRISASDTVRTPSSLAWDGTNLFVADPFNLRVLVFTVADQMLPITSVRNSASKEIFAVAILTFTADPKENDEVTVKISSGETSSEYKYKAATGQTIAHVITGLVEAINGGAGDPLVFASPNIVFNSLTLSARQAGAAGNDIAYAVSYSASPQITGPSSGTLSGGQDAAKIAPGTIVMILGENLSSQVASAPLDANPLPSTLGGVEVYFDGIRAPLLFVSPTEIRAQMPWEVNDAYNVNAYVRISRRDGTVDTTTAIGVPVIPQNPGIFAEDRETDPRPARAFHASGYATGVVSVDGSIKAGDQVIVSIEDRNYGHTVQASDTLAIVRDSLVAQISADDPRVDASASTVFTRIVLRARIPGQEGEGIPYSARANDGASIIMTALSAALCCAAAEGGPITAEDPARPGELIRVFATGLGIVGPDEAKFSVLTGWKYDGPPSHPNSPVDAIAGGKTANVLFAGLAPGMVGVYELTLQLNSDIPTNPQTQLTIAQDIFVSNIVTFAVVNPSSPPE